MLELRKKGNKHWLLIDEEIGEFTPSKFTINRLNNVINVVYFNNLKSKEYNVSDCYIFDIDDTSGFNTSSGVAFMDKLEELNCPCFQKDETIIIGGVIDISGKLDKVSTAGVERAYIINPDGSQGTKATSEFGGDETTSSIQAKRPLKTVNGESLEGSGNIQIDYNDLDNLPTIPTIITNHSGLSLDDGTNPHGTTKSDVGLDNVNNTSDADKPISTANQNALNLKLDKVSTAGVERAYIINADGTQGTKATSEFKDVLEFTDFDAFPTTGESGKIYVSLDTNSTYRWTGSAYVEIGGGSETLLQVKGFATDFPIANLLGTSAPMSNINIASGTADYNRSLISTTETGHQGIVALRSSTNANSGFCFFYGGNIVNNGDKHVSFFQFKLPTVTDVKGYVGFHTSTTTAEPVSACFLEIVNNSGVFKTKGVLLTTASTSFTLNTNTWYSLMIEFKSTTEVYFKIKLDDGTLVAEFTSTTNLPLFNTSSFTIAVNIFSTVATTARDLMLLDYVEYRPEKPNHLKSF